MTKKNQGLYENYLRAVSSDDVYLSDVYGSYSTAKERAWNWCFTKMQSQNGYGFRIVSHNIMVFTCAWLYDAEDGTHMNYETAQHSYDVLIR